METIKSILEIINYLSAPVLVFLAYKGLEQIKVARETNKINSKRDAFKIAAEQCNTFKDIVIPYAKNLSDEIKKKDIKFFEMFDVKIDGNMLKVQPKQKIPDEEYDKLDSLEHLIAFHNSLEGYALYFTSGVAEDLIGFNTTGKAFCNMVEQYLPLLAVDFNGGNYKNIKKLYFHWHKRIETEKILLEKNRLEDKLKANKTVDFKSIGT